MNLLKHILIYLSNKRNNKAKYLYKLQEEYYL